MLHSVWETLQKYPWDFYYCYYEVTLWEMGWELEDLIYYVADFGMYGYYIFGE